MKINIYKIWGKMNYYSFKFGLFIKPVVRPIIDFFENQHKKISDKPLIFSMMVIDLVTIIFLFVEIGFLTWDIYKKNGIFFLNVFSITVFFHAIGLTTEFFKERYKYIYNKDFKLPDLKKLGLWRILRFI